MNLFYDSLSIARIVEQLYPSSECDSFSVKNVLNYFGKEQLAMVEAELSQDDLQGIDLVRFLQLLLPVVPHSQDQLIYLTIALIEIFRVRLLIPHPAGDLRDHQEHQDRHERPHRLHLRVLRRHHQDRNPAAPSPHAEAVQPRQEANQAHRPRSRRRRRPKPRPAPPIQAQPPDRQPQAPQPDHRPGILLQGTPQDRHRRPARHRAQCLRLGLLGGLHHRASPAAPREVGHHPLFRLVRPPEKDGHLPQRSHPLLLRQPRQLQISKEVRSHLSAEFHLVPGFLLEVDDDGQDERALRVGAGEGGGEEEVRARGDEVGDRGLGGGGALEAAGVRVVRQEGVPLGAGEGGDEGGDRHLGGRRALDGVLVRVKAWVIDVVSFQLILTAGYENRINAFRIHETVCDYELKGKFVGSASMVTAISLMRDTSYLVSVDDFGCVRLWDIRTLKCVQQVSIGNKAKVTRILDMSEWGLMGFVGSRLNTLGLHSPPKAKDPLHPLRVEVQGEQVVVATKKDVRVFSLATGRLVKKVNMEDEISCFHSFGKIYVVGNQRGQLSVFKHNFEAHGHMVGHSNEVLHMKYDAHNEMLVSAAIDNRVLVQKLTSHLHREILNVPARLLELSVHHNLLVTSTGPALHLFDYELAKLLSTVHLANQEATALAILNPYALLLVATTASLIHILAFSVKEQTFVTYHHLAALDASVRNQQLSQVSGQTGNFHYNRHSSIFDLTKQPTHGDPKFVTKIVPDVDQHQTQLYAATASGQVIRFDLTQLVKDLPKPQPAYTRPNYNPYRYAKEDFLKAKLKVNSYQMESVPTIHECIMLEFQAHRDLLTGMSLVQLNQWYLLTYSSDGCFKFWTVSGDNAGMVNINHPLPILWNIEQENSQKFKQQFLYAMKALQALTQVELTQSQREAIQMERFLSGLVERSRWGEQKARRKEESVYLMREEYSPRDLRCEEAKEVQETGPKLKAMQVSKKMDELQSEWKKQEKRFLESERVKEMKEKLRQKSNEKEQSMGFLEENYHLLRDSKLEERYVRSLKKKLEKVVTSEGEQSQRKVSQAEKLGSVKRRKKGLEDFYDYANKRIGGESLDSTEAKTQRTMINHQKKRIKTILTTLNQHVRQSKSSLSLQKLDGSSLSLDASSRQQANYSQLPRIKSRRGVNLKETEGSVERLLVEIRREAEKRIHQQNDL